MHLKALPMGKNVTIENHPCFLRERRSYELCKFTIKTGIAKPAIPYPPVAVFTKSEQERIEYEIIQNLKTESRNQNVTGLAE